MMSAFEELELEGSFAKPEAIDCPSWPGVLPHGNLLARFQRAVV